MRTVITEAPGMIESDFLRNYSFGKNNPKFQEKVTRHVKNASDLYFGMAKPCGIIMDVSCSQFKSIYSGEGLNETRTPLGDIMTDDAVYILFAVTLGPDVSSHISRLFKNGEYLLGHMLDQACSAGIEGFADCMTKRCFSGEVSKGRLAKGDVMLRYSPGYCGWHISGQKILHEQLESQDAGIRLTGRYYMEPIKSISGVMIGGSPAIHNFKNKYSFCTDCRTRNCRDRLAKSGRLP